MKQGGSGARWRDPPAPRGSRRHRPPPPSPRRAGLFPAVRLTASGWFAATSDPAGVPCTAADTSKPRGLTAEDRAGHASDPRGLQPAPLLSRGVPRSCPTLTACSATSLSFRNHTKYSRHGRVLGLKDSPPLPPPLYVSAQIRVRVQLHWDTSRGDRSFLEGQEKPQRQEEICRISGGLRLRKVWIQQEDQVS